MQFLTQPFSASLRSGERPTGDRRSFKTGLFAAQNSYDHLGRQRVRKRLSDTLRPLQAKWFRGRASTQGQIAAVVVQIYRRQTCENERGFQGAGARRNGCGLAVQEI